MTGVLSHMRVAKKSEAPQLDWGDPLVVRATKVFCNFLEGNILQLRRISRYGIPSGCQHPSWKRYVWT